MVSRRTWALGAALCVVQGLWGPDLYTLLRWGFVPVDERPIGTPLVASAAKVSLTGRTLTVHIGAKAVYTEARHQATPRDFGPSMSTLRRYSVAASLQTEQGEAVELPCAWERETAGEKLCTTELPVSLPDGEHTLTLTVTPPSGMAPITVTQALPVFAPARTHLLTDRPQYAPGEVIKARSLTFARRDLTPLPGRSGTFTLKQNNEALLVVEATGDDWGVATAEIPLPARPLEDASVQWCSGEDCDSQALLIEDIALPWLLVDAAPSQSWAGIGEEVTISGTVTTADGRPAGGATVTPSLSVSGDWPLPTDWEPVPLEADRQGRFRLTLPPIPADLHAPVTLMVGLAAEDGAGGSTTTSVPVPLSPDPVLVSAITELGGLAEGISNRVYLLLTSPDGTPLANQEARIVSRYDGRDEGRTATTDAHGVLSMQLDPGPPAAILKPVPPVRLPPPDERPRIELVSGQELLSGAGLSLAARADFEAVVPTLTEACVGLLTEEGNLTLGVYAERGRIQTVSPQIPDRPADPKSCLGRVLTGMSWTEPGMWSLTLNARPDPLRPELTGTLTSADSLPSGLQNTFTGALRLGAACVADATTSSTDLAVLSWHLPVGARSPDWRGASSACIRDALEAVRLSQPAKSSAQGIARLGVTVPEPPRPSLREPQTISGWEFAVTVDSRTGRWVTTPTEAPPLRLRPTAPIVDEGEGVAFSAIRGRDFRGSLPAVLTLRGPGFEQTCGTGEDADESCPPQVDGEWRFSPPRGGIYWTHHDDALAAVIVRSPAGPGLSLTADKQTVAPGESITFIAQTDGPAVVSVVGHDARLAALMRLPRPTDLLRATFDESGPSAFGRYSVLDLVTGSIQGEATALAILSRLRHRQQRSGARTVSRSPFFNPDTTEALSRAVAEVALEVRVAFSALPDDQLTYEEFARLWDATATERDATDPWGLPLTLTRIAASSEIDRINPRDLIDDAARMPEDIEPWSTWAMEHTR